MESKLLLEGQRAFFAMGYTQQPSFRKQMLRQLKSAIKTNRKAIAQALYEDLGKSEAESEMSEIGLSIAAIDWQLRHLDGLAGDHWHLTPLHQFPSVGKTRFIPHGTTLIMAPWNYPFCLVMIPLAEAIAAGNTAIVKPGHASKATAKVIASIIEQAFEPSYVACVLGGREQISELLELPFDFIFFTGGKTLGRIVMEKAAAHLTPVVLELGGKSPALVDESANLALAARRIVFGKFLNAGQTCVAPDYVLVHESVKEPFLAALKTEIQKQYPDPALIGKIITQAHFERLQGLINPDQIVCGGRVSEPTRQIEPTVLADVSWEDPVMQDEIFGPILPVLTYTDFKAITAHLASLPKPLAFYLFSRNAAHKKIIERVQPFGGGCINDTVSQIACENLPFGGMGQSGMGHYHGRAGFETFSHEKSILIKGSWPDLPMRYANRKPWMAGLFRFFLG